MSRLYGPQHREFQDRFDSRRMADRIEQIAAQTEIDDTAKAFIESRDMFFLATVDHNGRPTVSYKGGNPGFVKVLDAGTIAFPSYDGNGMYLSMGNVSESRAVGLLFIDFEAQRRMRVDGLARIEFDDPLLGHYPEAQFIIRVEALQIYPNCPRYIHRYQLVERSRFVPHRRSGAGASSPPLRRSFSVS